jgi:hypothetical protein
MRTYSFIRNSILLAVILIATIAVNAQTISPHLFGQNAWMPDKIGTTVLNGRLHQNWHHIQESNAQTVRFGGIAPDQDMPTNAQYIQMIDSIRRRGMEPIMQVPFYNGRYNATQAANIVRYINGTMKRNIRYWIIGNEPDHVYKFTSPAQVAPYIRAFSFAMKDADPSIKIIGPETAWYNHSILRGITNPGGPDDLTGKDSKGRWIIDIISFHYYGFNGSQSRENVINDLMAPNKFNEHLVELKGRLANCNSRHGRTGSAELKMAVTEANVNFYNSSTDNLQGNGATSFIGGQYWAEMLAIAMRHGVELFNFWSVVEGNNQQLNIGFLDRTTLRRQPSWHHFKMLAENFRGNFARGTSSHNRIKTFGSKSTATQVAVMVMNQSSSANIDYRLRLNTGTVSGSTTAKLTIDAGIAAEYNDIIPNQSTQLLIFDHAGNLMRKCEYRMNGHANNNLPPTCTNFPPAARVTASGPTSICSGQSITLSTDNISGYNYQWRRNGANIQGATSSSFTANSAGSYTVEVKSIGGTRVSAVTNVTVSTAFNASVSITSTATDICRGNSVTYTATANTSNGAPTYQWRRNGNIVGTNSPSYTTTSLSDNDAVHCIVTYANTCAIGSPATSNTITAKVTASSTPEVKIAASETTICWGTPVTFTAQATNEGNAPNFEWRRNGQVAGQGQSYTLTNPMDRDAIECILTSNKTCVTTPTAKANMSLKVIKVEAAVKALGPLSFCEGDSVVLESSAGATYKYQWLKNNKTISGATSALFKAVNNGAYKVAVTDSGCTVQSQELIVDVTSKPAAEVKVIGSNSLCEAPTILLHVDNELGNTYQWRVDSLSIFSAKDYMYETREPGIYSVVVSNKCGTTTSDGYSITACSETGIDGADSPVVKFFPNPTSGNLTVELYHSEHKEARIEILNSLGQLLMIKEEAVNDGKAVHQVTFDSSLATGIYILKVTSGDFNFNTRIIFTNPVNP